jgi:peptidoglycan/LPS O-acetylase OafA/YrhL
MVLSGFIFVYGADAGAVRFGGFLRNRLLRIYPMYLVTIALGASLHPGVDQWWGVIRYLLPLANTGPALFGPPAAMAWAVAVEFQFYLIFPFLFALLHRHGAGLLWRMLALIVILRLSLVAAGHDLTALSYWTLGGRIDQFLLGMLAAHWLNRRGSPRRLGWWLAPALAALILGLYAFHKAGGFPVVAWWRALVPPVEGAVWAAIILGYLGLAPRLPTLELLGRVSFSLYLLHLLVIEALGPILPRLSADPFLDALAWAVMAALPLSIALAALAYTTVEAPFMALRERYWR